MRILITGGAGYIGTELCKKLALLKEISEIVIYDNFSRHNYNLFYTQAFPNADKIKLIKGDILDTRLLESVLENIDVIYHLAAKVTTPFADHSSQEYEQTNTWGTADLVYLAEKSNIKKFIHISSLAVYGASDTEIEEHSPLFPKTFYGISKLKGEHYVANLFSNSSIDASILRLGNVYGYSASMRFDSVINKYVFESKYYNVIRVFGNGEQKRSFIHINEVTDVLISFLTSALPNDIYNLTQTNITINEVAEVLKELNPKLDIIYVNQHVGMRNLIATKDHRLQSFQNTSIDFKKDLQDILNHFI